MMNKNELLTLFQSVETNEPEHFRVNHKLAVDYIPDDIASFHELEGGGESSSDTYRFSLYYVDDEDTGAMSFISSYNYENLPKLVEEIDKLSITFEDDELDELDPLDPLGDTQILELAKILEIGTSEVQKMIEEGKIAAFESSWSLFSYVYVEDAYALVDLEIPLEDLFNFKGFVEEHETVGEAFLKEDERFHCINDVWYMVTD